MVDHESRKCLLPLLAEHLDHQQWQKMMGCDDPTTAVWRCTNPCKDKHSVSQSKLMSTFSKIDLQFMMMKISFLLFNCLPTTYLQFSSQPYQTFSWLLGIILRSPLRTACSHKHKMHNKIVKELMIYEPKASGCKSNNQTKNVVIIGVIDNATVSEAFFGTQNCMN